MNRYYTTTQAAKVLGVGVEQIKSWTKEGRLDHYRTEGGHRRIPLTAVAQFRRDNPACPYLDPNLTYGLGPFHCTPPPTFDARQLSFDARSDTAVIGTVESRGIATYKVSPGDRKISSEDFDAEMTATGLTRFYRPIMDGDEVPAGTSGAVYVFSSVDGQLMRIFCTGHTDS